MKEETISYTLHCYWTSKNVRITTTRCPTEIGFRSNSYILMDKVFYWKIKLEYCQHVIHSCKRISGSMIRYFQLRALLPTVTIFKLLMFNVMNFKADLSLKFYNFPYFLLLHGKVFSLVFLCILPVPNKRIVCIYFVLHKNPKLSTTLYFYKQVKDVNKSVKWHAANPALFCFFTKIIFSQWLNTRNSPPNRQPPPLPLLPPPPKEVNLTFTSLPVLDWFRCVSIESFLAIMTVSSIRIMSAI